jgi:acetyl/propionyl-CoA carboxylase alpha subunit
MISKLAAWAEDRPHALARMRRALGEYLVTGIKTTLPFHRWLLAQPEFAEGRFHTTYLDDVLEARGGRPFGEVVAGAEEIAAIAAVVHAALSPPPAGCSPLAVPGRSTNVRWKAQARADGLRSDRA